MPDTDQVANNEEVGSQPTSSDDALRRALLALKDLRARAERAEGAATEPIAIVGIGCRFPSGANSPAQYWDMLRAGRDGVGAIPQNRWDHEQFYDPDPDMSGKIYTDQGGFVDQPVDVFDAPFFGIAPVEANDIDPQQRLLMEVTWEALEHAGIAPDQLVGTPTGVFIGLSTYDYSHIMMREVDPIDLGTYAGTGIAGSVAAGRLSYSLGLRGPSVCLDTACSSSLVSLAMATQSLRAGACRTALAGGVNLMLDPQAMISLSMLRVLSPTGRCHTFGAGADGYVRGEGAGMVVMKRLSDARADGDRILAVIRSAAVNHDGRSSGLTVPSGAAQREVIERALEEACLEPADIDVVEAHGTGTHLGDPIEVRSLDAVYSRGRSTAQPLLLGSAKTNIGHLEAAAGIAGVIKAVLALQHELVPPHLHCEELSPHIDWSSMPVEVNRRLRPWERGERVRRAAVSGFGWGGTNAHVILEEAPLDSTPVEWSEAPVVVPLSARDDAALGELALQTADALAGAALHDPALHGPALHDLAWTLQDGRARFRRRLAVTAASPQEAVELLRTAGARLDPAHAESPGSESAGVSIGSASTRPRVAFVFTGQGAQLPRMGRDLYDHEPVFRSVLDECDDALAPHLPHRLLDVMYGADELAELIHQTQYTQPAMFALQSALAAQWQSWGVTPDVVIGHSIGEYAAAVSAGVMDLSTASELIAARGTLMGALPAGGKMVAVFADEDAVDTMIADRRDVLSIAAVNGPSNIVVSGDGEAVDKLVVAFDDAGIRHRALEVSHAFHSPSMAPMIDAFDTRTSGAELHAPSVAFVSTVTGQVEKDAIAAPGYWRDQVMATVRFAAAIDSVVASGVETFLEIGPQPTLLGMIARIRGGGDGLHASLRPNRDDRRERAQLRDAVGSLWAAGVEPGWQAIDGGVSAKVAAPTYPFQRQRFWIAASTRRTRPTNGHPLLGAATRAPALGATIHEAVLGTDAPAWLDDHRLSGVAVLPGSAFAEMALAVCDAGEHIESMSIRDALVLPADGDVTVQTIVTDVQNRREVQVVSIDTGPSGDGYTLHATASIGRAAGLGGSASTIDLATAEGAYDVEVDVDEYYARMHTAGLTYGPTFRGVTRMLRREGAALGQVRLPPGSPDAKRYRFHPALFDACFHVLVAAIPTPDDDSEDMFVPVSIDGVRVVRPGATSVWCSATLLEEMSDDSTRIVARLEVFDEAGQPVASIDRYEARRTPKSLWEQVLAPTPVLDQLYELAWHPQSRPEPADEAPVGSWVVVAHDGASTDALVAHMTTAGIENIRVLIPSDSARLGELVDEAAHSHTGAPVGVVVLCDDDEAGRETTVSTALGASQQLAARAASDSRLWLVTRGGQSVDGEPPSIGGAAVWGLGRTIANEQPQLACVCVDLDPAPGDDPFEELAAELLTAPRDTRPADDQIALRGPRRLVARLVRHDTTRHAPPPSPYGLVLAERGSLDQLSFASISRREPGTGEVEIEVRATGLNFRDVLNVLGMYPGDPGLPGLECAGIVTAIGDDVVDHTVGDAVFGIAPQAFDSHVVTLADLVVPIPPETSFAEAATLPIAYLTAMYGFSDLADLQAGETVLIHAAAGGVGMAAVSLAHSVGAEVFATVGSAEKRRTLEALGVRHIYNSRTLDFAEQILADTDGRGVDVVLNSLSDEFIDRSFDVLSPSGRFLEIGKRGVWSAEQAAAVRPNAGYHIYELADFLATDPAGVRRSLQAVADGIMAGTVAPLPLRVFPVEDIRDAFRFMAQARHIGKVVMAHRPDVARIRDDGAYVVTGGLGGLGLAVARWLIDEGALDLTLAGRSAPSAEVLALLDEMRAAGARIRTVQADVSEVADVERLVAAATEGGVALRGVFHAAGVLDDGALAQQSWPRFESVFAPKLSGAEHLDVATRDADLDHMVFFSSVSAVLGSPGQSNYAAANSALDALAHRRRALGRPALSINWGAWAEAGMTARLDPREHQRMADRGIGLLTTDMALDALGRLLDRNAAQVAVIAADWPKMFAAVGGTPPPLLSDLGSATPLQLLSDAPDPGSLVDDLAAVEPHERRDVTIAHVAEQVVQVLGLGSGASIDADQALAELGMDSLMAVELTNRLRASTGLALEPTLAFDHPTANAVSEHLVSQLDRVVSLKAKLAAMSPEEVAAALAARRSATQGLAR